MTVKTGARGDAGGRAKSALLTGALLLPVSVWYFLLLVVPLAMVAIFSFGRRATNGGYAPDFTLDNYARALATIDPFLTSLTMSIGGTIGTLLVGLPLAYFMATRAGRWKGLLLLLLIIPF